MLTAIHMPMQSQWHGTQLEKPWLALRAQIHVVLSETMGRALRRVIIGASLLAIAANCSRAEVTPAPPDGNPRVAAILPFLFGGGSQPLYDSLPGDVKPHPAVARIIVPEDGSTAYGSGTLVGVHDQHGLVVTNWHVVRDAVGMVEVVFPDGFRSNARPIQVDQDWDLAALVIWRPPGVEPVRIAAQPPRPGDVLTIHGYGRGKYRIATGRCTTYYAPQPNYPHEMVELDVEARQGDSGGPIFNQPGELAGVLFGAGQGTTMGAFSPRVRYFLAAVAPNLEQANAQAQVAVADRPPPVVNLPLAPPAAGELPSDYPSSPWSAPKPAVIEASNGAAATPQLVSTSAPALTANDHRQETPSNWYEPAKTVLAAIGLAAIGLRLVKVIL